MGTWEWELSLNSLKYLFSDQELFLWQISPQIYLHPCLRNQDAFAQPLHEITTLHFDFLHTLPTSTSDLHLIILCVKSTVSLTPLLLYCWPCANTWCLHFTLSLLSRPFKLYCTAEHRQSLRDLLPPPNPLTFWSVFPRLLSVSYFCSPLSLFLIHVLPFLSLYTL